MTAYDGKSKGAEAYNALAREFLARPAPTSHRGDAEAQKEKESIS